MVHTDSWFPAGRAKGGSTLALVLYSGSLASALAVRLAERAGVRHLRLVYFRSPFFQGEEEVGLQAQNLFGSTRFQCITLKRDFLSLGKRVTGFPFPCGRCRWLLLERVGRLARRLHADLVVTGEVVGRRALWATDLLALERAAGLAGCVVRPLSARVLPPTRAEEEGKVDRNAFLDLEEGDALGDRLRALATKLGIPPSPTGRECLFTDHGFVQRFLEFDSAAALTENMIQLLRFEHSYRMESGARVVVAVTSEEQARLQPLFLPTDIRLYVQMPGSPLALVRARWHEHTPEERERIIADAAERMAEVAELPRAAAWVVRFRCEWEGETRQMRLRVEGHTAPALISP